MTVSLLSLCPTLIQVCCKLGAWQCPVLHSTSLVAVQVHLLNKSVSSASKTSSGWTWLCFIIKYTQGRFLMVLVDRGPDFRYWMDELQKQHTNSSNWRPMWTLHQFYITPQLFCSWATKDLTLEVNTMKRLISAFGVWEVDASQSIIRYFFSWLV